MHYSKLRIDNHAPLDELEVVLERPKSQINLPKNRPRNKKTRKSASVIENNNQTPLNKFMDIDKNSFYNQHVSRDKSIDKIKKKTRNCLST